MADKIHLVIWGDGFGHDKTIAAFHDEAEADRLADMQECWWVQSVPLDSQDRCGRCGCYDFNHPDYGFSCDEFIPWDAPLPSPDIEAELVKQGMVRACTHCGVRAALAGLDGRCAEHAEER